MRAALTVAVVLAVGWLHARAVERGIERGFVALARLHEDPPLL